MYALTAPLLVLLCLMSCTAQSTGLEDEQEREEAMFLGLPSLPEPQEREVLSNPILALLLSIFNRAPQQSTETTSRESDSGRSVRSQGVPKRLYYAPRLGKRSSDALPDDSEARREKRQVSAGANEAADEDNYGSWWWPLVTVRRSPFVPRPGKREDGTASDLYDAEDLKEEDLVNYFGGNLGQETQSADKRENGFAFTPRLGKRGGMAFSPRLGKKDFAFVPRPGKKGDFAFVPRPGKKGDFAFVPRPGKKGDFAFVPRPGKKGDFAFTPRLGKRADFAFVPRPGRGADFAFTPRLGKKADFAFTPRLGKKADFAFTPRLGKREVEA